MSLFPEYLESLELSPSSHNWQEGLKGENHIQRQSMNKLVMDYLITGKKNLFLFFFVRKQCGRILIFERAKQGVDVSTI